MIEFIFLHSKLRIMTLIKSVSGIRGTIGGKPFDNLTPVDLVKFSTAFVQLLKAKTGKGSLSVILGRDARPSGEFVRNIVVGTLVACGVKVIDIGLATTPTVEIAVTEEEADGGIILTASHNPKNWNALKLLNRLGEFISAEDGNLLLSLVEEDFEEIQYAFIEEIGSVTYKDYLDKHIELILNSRFTDKKAIKAANFTVAVDAVNSVGGIAIPALLSALGVKQIKKLYCEPTGEFPHNPEPLPENLQDISNLVKDQNVDVGFVVDPDVDRLAIINEDGSMFGEEYTLVAVADYVLSIDPGNTVSNLSSTRALRDLTNKYHCKYSASAVGEVNVVEEMKRVNAVIGGEGNGGVILPELHYGRDALAGIALFLSHLARTGKKCSELRAIYPDYHISKHKIQLTPDIDTDLVLDRIKGNFENRDDVQISTVDGVKLDFETGWIHLRKSNTEPIIRIYSEAKTLEEAEKSVGMIKKLVKV
jgi:phosphomannomutase